MIFRIIVFILLTGCFRKRNNIPTQNIIAEQFEIDEYTEEDDIQEKAIDQVDSLPKELFNDHNHISEQILQHEEISDTMIRSPYEWNLPFKYSKIEQEFYDSSLIKSLNANDNNVLPARPGRVIYVGNHGKSQNRPNKTVIVEHNVNDKKWITSYSNLNKISVSHGEIIRDGEIDKPIGLSFPNEGIKMSAFEFSGNTNSSKQMVKIKDLK